MIPFNKPPVTGEELASIQQAIHIRKLSGDGEFTRKCSSWLEQNTGSTRALLTTSCTHALEMAALLACVQPGDEVILPSFTFPSTATAFALRGAQLVFVDIRPDTLNIDETRIEDAITSRTKVIVPVHYAGVSCEMDTIMEIASAYHLLVVEDAAQAVMSAYKGHALGSIGDIGCYSFHESKNYSMGEGGAILLQDPALADRAEILREKGTNRSQYFRGQADRYTWMDIGSSYLPSELNAAFLYAQLMQAEKINTDRMQSWTTYHAGLQHLQNKEILTLPTIPENCTHNAHMFYIKLKNEEVRSRLINHLHDHGIMSVFHYIPLHSSKAGQTYGQFHGLDQYTTKESRRVLRLPMYYGLLPENCAKVIQTIEEFFK